MGSSRVPANPTRKTLNSNVEIAQMWLAVTTLDAELKGKQADFHGISEKIPATEAELADVLGIGKNTLTGWKKKSDFRLGVDNMMRQIIGMRLRQNAMKVADTLVTLAASGDPRMQKLFWDKLEQLAPGIMMEHDDETIELKRKNVSKTGGANDELKKLLDLLPRIEEDEDTEQPDIEDARVIDTDDDIKFIADELNDE